MDGISADCGSVSTLMKYELDVIGATGAEVKYVHACHADWTHLASTAPGDFETDGGGNRLGMWFGNGDGFGWNNYEGCCVFQSKWWEGGNARGVSSAYQVLMDSTSPNTNGTNNSHQAWINDQPTAVPYPPGSP
jgi:hypothetical protein